MSSVGPGSAGGGVGGQGEDDPRIGLRFDAEGSRGRSPWDFNGPGKAAEAKRWIQENSAV